MPRGAGERLGKRARVTAGQGGAEEAGYATSGNEEATGMDALAKGWTLQDEREDGDAKEEWGEGPWRGQERDDAADNLHGGRVWRRLGKRTRRHVRDSYVPSEGGEGRAGGGGAHGLRYGRRGRWRTA